MNIVQEFAAAGVTLLSRSPLAVTFLTLALSFSSLRAATFVEQKVVPDDGVGDDGFGYGAAIEGTTAMVGEAHATINGKEAQGEVYVYRRSGGQWVLTQKLMASDGQADDSFGGDIALGGNTAMIGATGVNNDRGAVYVFTNSGGTWTQTQKVTASDGAVLDWFGYSVAFSGTSLVVGARNAKGDRGAAYFYDGASGTWVLNAELTPGDVQPQDYFGNSVAISGTTALIGAFNINGANAGAAYVFTNSSDTWIQTQKLTPSDGQRGDWFGFAVDLNDTTAAIGASQAVVNGQLDQGAVYVFNNSGGTWTQTQKLIATDGTEFDALGWNVAINGNVILAGATGANAAYYFLQSRGTWSQRAELMASDFTGNGIAYGWAVDFVGRTTLVTAPFSMVNGKTEGAAYFYTRRRQ
jgi:FG-GAP repeat